MAVAPHSTGRYHGMQAREGTWWRLLAYPDRVFFAAKDGVGRSLARSVSSISIPRFSLACAPAFASRPSVRPHPQSATSQRYDVRVFLPSMIPCALAGEQDASGGGENSHVKTVGEKNLEEERKRRGPPAAAATAPPPFPIAPSLLPVQVPRALSSENMTTIISAVLERGGGGGGAAGRRAGGGKVGSCERT